MNYMLWQSSTKANISEAQKAKLYFINKYGAVFDILNIRCPFKTVDFMYDKNVGINNIWIEYEKKNRGS